jgi:hypothetical protein
MNRTLAIGCAVVLFIIAAVIGLAAWQAPKLIAKGKGLVVDAMTKQARINSMEGYWQPPSAEPDANWFPAAVGDWKLTSTEPVTTIPELHLQRHGQRASYHSEAGDMDVLVIPANEMEKGPMIAQISATLGARHETVTDVGGVKIGTSSSSSSMTSTWGNRTTTNHNGELAQFWWIKGWLFIFRPRGNFEPEKFSDLYIGGVPAESPKVEKE